MSLWRTGWRHTASSELLRSYLMGTAMRESGFQWWSAALHMHVLRERERCEGSACASVFICIVVFSFLLLYSRSLLLRRFGYGSLYGAIHHTHTDKKEGKEKNEKKIFSRHRSLSKKESSEKRSAFTTASLDSFCLRTATTGECWRLSVLPEVEQAWKKNP